MKNCSKNYRRRWSLFMKIVFGIACVAVAAVVGYFALKFSGGVEVIRNKIGSGDNKWQTAVAFTAIESLLIVYIIVSIVNLFAYKAIEDSRMFSLHIIIAPIFLVAENALLNLMHETYYQVTMTVFAAIVTSVVTFAGLRFSFENSTRQKRFKETADVKPDIVITKSNGRFTLDIERNDCYLCGAFIGSVNKLWYIDTSKTGSEFEMHDLIYYNRKKLFRKSDGNSQIANKIDNVDLENAFMEISDSNIYSICNDTKSDVFLIFRDMVNYYYFVCLPSENKKSHTIGVSEYTMNKLVRENSKMVCRIYNGKKQKKKYVSYKAMDWFGIPYNIYSDIS